MEFSGLPGSFLHAGNLTLVSQLSEADTADAVVAQVRMRTTADLAAGVSTSGVLGLSLLFHFHGFLRHNLDLP